LLQYLLARRDQVIEHGELLQAVWGAGYDQDSRLLHDTISRLRNRFQEAGVRRDHIETVHGIGYRLRGAETHGVHP
jgi:two-component system response regulator RegX3